MLIRKIWELKHNLFISRNLVVHPLDTKTLNVENKYIDEEIMAEFSLGIVLLPRLMKHLFKGRVTMIL